MKILVTGTAGFIASHLANKLIKDGYDVYGLDSINEYYDIQLKYDRLKLAGIDAANLSYNKITQSTLHQNYKFIKLDLEDKDNLSNFFQEFRFDAVCNLAAQAGVRYSIESPDSYIQSNIVGFFNILEECRNHDISNLSFASSSSVYGLNESYPFKTSSSTDHPMSLYAASKKSNEVMAHSYASLYKIKTTGLRFFTVYGPWGRPDMALFLFTKAAIENKPIDVFNHGDMARDFTYIDDIINGIKLVIDNPAQPNIDWSGSSPISSSSSAPYKIYNIGNNNPVKLTDFIDCIEKKVGKKIQRNYVDIQLGDVPSTFASIDDFHKDLGYESSYDIQRGVNNFIEWYIDYFKIRI
jgi:UDP-glucuronate 4-epimerase